MSKPKRTWVGGKVVRCKHGDGDWRLVLADGREFLLPRTYTFSRKETAEYARMMFGAKIDA